MSTHDPSDRWREINDDEARRRAEADAAPTRFSPPSPRAGDVGAGSGGARGGDTPSSGWDDPYAGSSSSSYGQADDASPYGQQGYAATPYGSGAYGPPVGYGPPAFAYAPPQHPSSTTSLVLGLVALIGSFMCIVPIVLAPFAWATGAKAVREIDASAGRLGGRGQAQAGMIIGIIGTVLLGLGLVSFALLIIGIAAA